MFCCILIDTVVRMQWSEPLLTIKGRKDFWMEENKQNQDIEFIKEKVKERPLNRRKLLKRTIVTASMAVIFGLIACFTFLVLEPVFTNLLYPQEETQQVELKEESINEEMRPEDMILEEETESEAPAIQQTVVEKVEIEISDYQRLYRLMYALVQQASNSMVTVTGVVTDMDWFDNPYENQGQASGLIVAENGKELLILTELATVKQADSVKTTFSDGTQAAAQLKGADEETGLAIVSVALEEIEETTRESITTAVLGGSGSSLLASPVIAAGRPLGRSASVVYGMVTSTDTWASLADQNVRILTTDMTGNSNASGVLLNLSGQVVGIIRPGSSKSSTKETVLSAYGTADLRKIIEKLSNGQEIAHMGIIGTDVPQEVSEELGVPIGAYVTGIRMDSPAMQAGIQSGDVIVKLGTVEIASFSDYQEAMMNLSPDTAVTVVVMRQGQDAYQEMPIDVILGR